MDAMMKVWGECDWAEPINVVQVPNDKRYEIKRRVVCDNLAKERHYILADVGCVPEDKRMIPSIAAKIKDEDGLIGLSPSHQIREFKGIPCGVRVCLKGNVQKWPQKWTDTYDKEHAEAVKLTGKKVEVWSDIFYKQLQAC